MRSWGNSEGSSHVPHRAWARGEPVKMGWGAFCTFVVEASDVLEVPTLVAHRCLLVTHRCLREISGEFGS